MLQTNLGQIDLFINDLEVEYEPIPLTTSWNAFVVDGRYKIVIDLKKISGSIEIYCTLNISDKFEYLVDSGENLLLVSFIQERDIVSIGVEDEVDGIYLETTDQGIKLLIHECEKVEALIIGVAWKTMTNPSNEITDTWFAADPTLFKEL